MPWSSLPGSLIDHSALTIAALPSLDPAVATVAAWRSANAMHLALPEPVSSPNLRERVLARWWRDGRPAMPAAPVDGQRMANNYNGLTIVPAT